jgi:hypothetical protein
MLDKLINLIRQHAGDSIINNPSIPNDQNEMAVETAGTSILDTLKNALANGRLNDVLGYFKQGQAGSPGLVREATDKYSHDLQNKLGIPVTTANQTASATIPNAMDQFAIRTTDPSDNNFDIQDIFNMLSGNKTGGLNIQALLNKFGGGRLDKDRDGDVDLQDLQSMLTGSGGMMGNPKGMFN